MLVIHFVIIVLLALVWTILAIFHESPILPALAFISWLAAAYQSLAIELPYAYGNPATVVYEPYTGGGALALYFLGMAGVMFVYFAYDVFQQVMERRRK